jgi:uncharacterized paraquat-inducible protein A
MKNCESCGTEIDDTASLADSHRCKVCGEKLTTTPQPTQRRKGAAAVQHLQTIVFRVLAGLLALGFGAFLVFGDTSKMSLRQVVGGCVIAVAFGLYSLLGPEVGERFLAYMIGIRNPDGSEKSPGNSKKS